MHGDHVTAEQFKAGLAEVRTDIADLRADIYRAMLVQTGVTVGLPAFSSPACAGSGSWLHDVSHATKALAPTAMPAP